MVHFILLFQERNTFPPGIVLLLWLESIGAPLSSIPSYLSSVITLFSTKSSSLQPLAHLFFSYLNWIYSHQLTQSLFHQQYSWLHSCTLITITQAANILQNYILSIFASTFFCSNNGEKSGTPTVPLPTCSTPGKAVFFWLITHSFTNCHSWHHALLLSLTW